MDRSTVLLGIVGGRSSANELNHPPSRSVANKQRIRYNRPVGKRWCDVMVQTPDGKRHTITVESESVYDAAIKFFGRAAAAFPGDGLPKTTNDTVFEVRPIYRVTHAKLMEWANKKAEIYARSKKFRKWL